MAYLSQKTILSIWVWTDLQNAEGWEKAEEIYRFKHACATTESERSHYHGSGRPTAVGVTFGKIVWKGPGRGREETGKWVWWSACPELSRFNLFG